MFRTLFLVSALLHHACADSCIPTSTTHAPWYPGDTGFDTSGFISIEKATEIIKLRVTPNYPPSGWNSKLDCPYDNEELLAWEDATTWPSNTVPIAGEDVTLPTNASVLLSGCSVSSGTVFGGITIPENSKLIFADEDISFNTTGITVYGELVLGSETCRLNSRISITLHGVRPPSSELPAAPSYKGITAQNSGVLNIHGSIFHPTWTRLATTVASGDTEIYLQHKVNWQAGQEIVIISTEIKDSRDWHHNEVRIIQKVELSGSFSRITLTEPLDYTHYGGSEYQAEVGLLSHNVIIQGDESSEGSDTENDVCSTERYPSYPCEDKHLTGFGGHTLGNGTNAVVRFEGVELYRMGQTNVLARYPFHLHHMGEGGKNSYLKHSSIHHSFYRCATIHGTNSSRIANNVAYDAIGHCYYSGEDGVEEKNTLAFNLGAHVHFLGYPMTTTGSQYMSTVYQNENLTQPADVSASPFYITRAYNRYVGNAASGGYAGFAIVKLTKPIMDYRNTTYVSGTSPQHRPFQEFNGNSCHSSGFWWHQASCIYIGGKLLHVNDTSKQLMYNPGRDSSPRNTLCGIGKKAVDCPLILNNTKVFLSNWGVNNWGQRGFIDGLEVHDTSRPVAILGSHTLTNLLFTCRSGNFVPEQPDTGYYGYRWFTGAYVGYETYDVDQRHIVDGIIMRKCGNQSSNAFVWRFLTHSDRYVPGFQQIIRNVTYDQIDKSMLFGETVEDYLSISGYDVGIYDADGTILEGRNGPQILGSAREGIEWWKLDENCTKHNDYYICDAVSYITGKSRGIASFEMNFDPTLDSQVTKYQICTNGDRSKSCPRVGSVMHIGQEGNPQEVGLPIEGLTALNGPTGGLGWLMLFDNGSPANITFKKTQIDEDELLMIAIPYPPGTSFNLTYYAAYWCWYWISVKTCYHKFTSAASLDAVINGNGDRYFFDTDRGVLFFRYIVQDLEDADFSQAPAYGNLGLSYYTYKDMRIPYTQTYGKIQLVANCDLNATDTTYCVLSNYSMANICEDYGFTANSSIAAYDSCLGTKSADTVVDSLTPTGSSEKSSENPFSKALVIAAPSAVVGLLLLVAGAIGFIKLRHRRQIQARTPMYLNSPGQHSGRVVVKPDARSVEC